MKNICQQSFFTGKNFTKTEQNGTYDDKDNDEIWLMI